MADWLSQLRDADRALGRVAPSAALDARLQASLESRAARPRVGGRVVVLVACVGGLLVGLRAIERAGDPSVSPARDVASAEAPVVESPSIEPRGEPSARRRSADESAPPLGPRRTDRLSVPPARSAAPPVAPREREAVPPARPLVPSPRDGTPDASTFERAPIDPSSAPFGARRESASRARDGRAQMTIPPGSTWGGAGHPSPVRVGSLDGRATSPNPPVEGDAPEPPPDSPPPEGTCETETIDSGMCVDLVDLKLQASDALCADGLVLDAFDIDVGACPDGLGASATYVCCPPGPPPPPPEDKSGSGDSPSCKPIEVTVDTCAPIASLDAAAASQCGEGALVVDHKYVGECPEGAATTGWFTCCAVAQDNLPG